MAIQQGDIALVKSQVMLDTSNGGGGPTGNIIQNGASNSIFPDISELDRAGGRVSVRKVFPSVRAPGTNGFYGVNVIVAEAPADPNVAVTLFSTGDVFDRRDVAVKRMQSYLARGASWPGWLFGNHLAGQMNVTLLQRPETELPVVGQTMVLVGQINSAESNIDYVRVMSVAATLRTFTDGPGEYQRNVVILGISKELSADYVGFEAHRLDIEYVFANATRVMDTVVADAAHYYGVTRLAQVANANDYIIKGQSVYTQLVPSSRVEEPLVDVRPNQRSAAVVQAGGEITETLNGYLSTTQSLYIGGGVLPGSLTLTRDNITLTDSGGVLIAAGQTVGTVDYANGVISLATNVFGAGAGAHVVVYKPASQVTVVTDSMSWVVTEESVRRSWTFTIDPAPARGSLMVSYRALGRWYVLSDDGSGALRGTDSSFGAGNINFVTGGASVTLGALPDVHSRVLVQWAPGQVARTATSAGVASDQRIKQYIPLPAGVVFAPGSLSMSWYRSTGQAQAATDNGLGRLVGDAVGDVVYGAGGGVYFSPAKLPVVGAVINITLMGAEDKSGDIPLLQKDPADPNYYLFDLGVAVRPGSLQLAVVATFADNVAPGAPDNKATYETTILLTDDGAGNLVTNASQTDTNFGVPGAVDYAAGTGRIRALVATNQTKNTYVGVLNDKGDLIGYRWSASVIQSIGTFVRAAPTGGPQIIPVWAWWAGQMSVALKYRCAGSDTAPVTYSYTLSSLYFDLRPAEQDNYQYTVYPRFVQIGATRVVYERDGFLWRVVGNPAPNTGIGTVIGHTSAMRTVLTNWPADAGSTPTIVAGAITPALGAANAVGVTRIAFRSATAPLYAGAFQVAGAWSDTGATFTATANEQGYIDTCGDPATPASYGTRGVVGYVDYETGCCEIAFGQKIGIDVPTKTPGYVDPQTGQVVFATYEGGMNVEELGIVGLREIKAFAVDPDSMRYNATGFSFVSLDPEILGLDPTMLPNDGRVPMVRKGGFVVLGHTSELAAQAVVDGQSVNCGRERLSRVEVVGADGAQIDTGYSVDLDAGVVTFADVAGYAQPVKVKHRIEDLAQVRDVQIDGTLSLTRKITHSYPALESTVSSALVIGDMQVNTPVLFDQVTWLDDWLDVRVGNAATGTYDDASCPVELSNLGAVTERWLLQFQTNSTFSISGEHVGVIGSGSVNADCAPNNPATATPYFTLRSAGWGAGWAPGNVLRFNTVGAVAPIWVVRMIQPGEATVQNDSFALLVRGDVDRT